MAERAGFRGRVSRYEVKRAIGKGSYGEVFLVTHKGDDKQVGSSILHRPRASPQAAI